MPSMTSIASLALAAAPALAFQTCPSRPRPPLALRNSLRDMASFPDDMKMMSEFEAFDRNGAFSRSPRGRPGGNLDPYGSGGQGQGGGGGGRMYTMDGFDPYSAYSQGFGGGGGPPPGYSQGFGGGGGPPPGAPAGGPRGFVNGVKADNTMGGFAYSSRGTDYGYGGGPYGGGPYGYDFDGGEMMGEGGAMYGGGPPPEMMGMDYGYGRDFPAEEGGGYGGFDGDLGRMGP